MLSRLFKAGEKVLLNLVNKKDFHMASRNQENSSPKVKELYDLCKETFTGKAPSPASMAVQKLCSVLDGVKVSAVIESIETELASIFSVLNLEANNIGDLCVTLNIGESERTQLSKKRREKHQRQHVSKLKHKEDKEEASSDAMEVEDKASVDGHVSAQGEAAFSSWTCVA